MFCSNIIFRAKNCLRKSQVFFYYGTYNNQTVRLRVLVYDCTGFWKLGPLLRIQERTVRTICFLARYARVTKITVENEITTVNELRVYELLKVIFERILSEHCYQPFKSFLKQPDFRYNLRSVKRKQANFHTVQTKTMELLWEYLKFSMSLFQLRCHPIFHSNSRLLLQMLRKLSLDFIAELLSWVTKI